jgi:hypothetical protein
MDPEFLERLVRFFEAGMVVLVLELFHRVGRSAGAAMLRLKCDGATKLEVVVQEERLM